jgi:alpha-ketoglutarate-dependent taurine dioxygenase
MDTPAREEKKFKRTARKTVEIPQEDLVKTSTFAPDEPLPLVIQPAVEGLDLADWSRSNRDYLETELVKHGAILFRGFNINNVTDFERFALTLCSELYKENAEHTPVSKDGSVQTPVFYSPDKKLLWHNENSFNLSWPMKIWFCCVRPADKGGETPLADSRRVFEMIDPALREEFLRKQVMYVRTFGSGLGLDWQTIFHTTSKAEVEAQCRADQTEFEWLDGDRLRTRAVRLAAGRHPKTGEMVWFNQAQHWHVACLDPVTRQSMEAIFAEEDMPRHCYFGDGSKIPDEAMYHICDMYEKAEVSFPWQAGDVVMVDNMLAAHARNPFVGERKLLVALGEMINHNEIPNN